MTVPDEAVEAAARAIRDDDWPDYEDRLHHPVKDYMSNARAALAAAAPFIAAQALSDAADTFHARLPDGTGNGRAYNSHQVALMLNERASTYRSEA